jgi:hypothetical protein
VTKDGRFIGLNIDCDTKDNSTLILPWELLMERFVYFEKYRYVSCACIYLLYLTEFMYLYVVRESIF